MTEAQPTITAAQPTITAAQPTITAAQPTITAAQPTITAAQPTITAAQPTARQRAVAAGSGPLSPLSGGIASQVHMLARRGRGDETDGTLTCMTAFVAFLVERLHVDLGHVSSAVCMAG